MYTHKIKFSPKNNPEFIRELRSKVNDYFDQRHLSKYGNAGMFVKVMLMSALYIVPYLLMVTGVVTSFPLILLSWIVMGTGMAGIGMVLMHDANHGTSTSNQKMNRWLSKSLYFLGGFPPNWRHQHNTMHHGFTNIDGHDEDIAPVGILRFSPHRPYHAIHKFQQWYAWLFYGLMTLSWVTAKDFKQLFRYKKTVITLSSNRSFGFMLADLIIAKVLYYTVMLVIPLIVIPIAWYWTVLFFLIMHFTAGFSLTVIFQTAHVMPDSVYPLPDEEGNVENNWAIHQLLTTSDYAPNSRIFSWLIGGLNYQVEHHLFPNISHVHYKKISVIVKQTADKYQVPYHVQPTFFKAVYNHYKMLKMLGNKIPPSFAEKDVIPMQKANVQATVPA